MGDASPLRSWATLRIVLACGVGSFMSALSTNLVNIAAPTMARDLGLATGDVSHVLTAYLLTGSVLLPIAGHVGDAVGKKRVFVTGFAMFGVCALLCSRAESLAGLVAARALQGVAAAMLMAMGPAIVVRAFPPSHRARAVGLQLSLTYLGLLLGPSLGGVIVVALGWRAIFVVLAVVSVVGTMTGLAWLDSPPPQPSPSGGGGRSSWMFLFQAPFGLGIVAALLLYTTTFMLSFSLPFELEHGRGVSAREAGFFMASQPFVMFFVAPFGGWLADRFGRRWPSTVGMLSIACGCALLTHAAHAASPVLVVALGLVGLGGGMFVAPNSASLFSAAPKDRQGTAAAAAATARNLGMACGVALAGYLLARTGAHRVVMWTSAALAIAGALLSAFRPDAGSAREPFALPSQGKTR